MKTHMNKEDDQIMTDVGAEQNCRKKDKKKKKLQQGSDAEDKIKLVACNREVKDDGDEKALMDDIEETEKERKAEKKKRKKEKRELKLLQNGKDDGDDKDLMDEIEETEKERKAEKKKRKKEKRELKSLQNGKEMEKQMDEAVILRHEEMEVERNPLLSDDKGKKKRKEKKPKGDTVDVDDEHNAVAGKKKGNVNIMEARKAVYKKRKRKEKETEDDMDKGAMEGNTDSEVPKTQKKAGAADSSEKLVPRQRSKKVVFSDEVTVFPLSGNNEIRSDLDKDGVVRGKRFTKEEDELVIKAVKDFVKRKQLPVSEEEGVRMVMNSKAHPEVRFCWNEIAEDIPWRPKDSVCHRAHILLDQQHEKKEYTKEEQEQLRVWYKEKGPKWREMGDELGRSRKHVKDVVRRIGLVDKNKGHWSQEEYQKLFDLVNKDLQMKIQSEKKSKHGMLKDDIAWGAISDVIGTRSMHTCCMKWYGQLESPMVAQKQWSNADDYFMMEALVNLDASCEEEVDWDQLLIDRRDGEICLKRWKDMTRHLGKHGNITFAEQVEILSKRYCPDLSEIRETLDARPIVD